MAILATLIENQRRSKRMKKPAQLIGLARMQEEMAPGEMTENLRRIHERKVEEHRKDN